METKLLLTELNKKVLEIYEKEKIFPLRGEKDCYIINGKELLVWYYKTTDPCSCHHGFGKFDYFTNIDELLFISDEIVYFTAHLYLYKPYINSPIKDAYFVGGNANKMVYPLFVNMEGKRYNMYIDTIYEKIYNFWDRIGDLIASCLPEKIKGNVYFGKTIKLLKDEYKGNPNFDWLLNFVENEYSSFNTERINIVHYISKSTSFKKTQLGNVSDFEKSKELHQKRLSYPEYFKKMNELCKTGFEKALLLIEEINKREKFECPDKDTE